ncbi:phage baseplate assembly protein domain-containing protein [Acinetobacter dispersus]|uniref:phage baseplate assembly protein domain-containing protein n=1 Tax=Acinetobacter dispersus TaxID=70348 RepID=UPI00132E8215|nr:phage baseplate assembly protein [Acinetobacter dispersus]QHH96683.1 baseplate assembly protein [Acinetobacter dispersus]
MISMAQVKKAIGKLRFPLFGMVARGGSKALQVTGLSNETLTDVELLQQIGFSSHIPENAKVVLIPLQGTTAKSVVIATKGGAILINVDEGETCVYDQFGHSVWLQEDGTHVKGGDLIIDDGNVRVLNGDVFDQTSSMQAMRDVYNDHKHGNSPPAAPPME